MQLLTFTVLSMDYSHITVKLIVGSQPHKLGDIDHLKEAENVAYIICLQQEEDIRTRGIDFDAVGKRCQELGIHYVRKPVRDFDPDSLRAVLPKAVAEVEWAISDGKGRVYVHCTGGLGRSPAVVVAFLFWFNKMDLDTAYGMLTSKRFCEYNQRAIRGATYDLVKNDDDGKEPFESLPGNAYEDIADWERQLIQDRVRALRHIVVNQQQ